MLGKNHIVTSEACALGLAFTLLNPLKFIESVPLLQIIRVEVMNHFFDLGFSHIYLQAAIIFALVYFGALLPDIDSNTSILGRYVHLPLEHRGFTHSFYFLLPFLIIGYFNAYVLWIAFGIFTHLLMDSFSYAGNCWFNYKTGYIRYGSGAIVKKKHLFKLYRVGKVSEGFVVAIVIVLNLLLVYIAFKK